jgi:hypothetical protein
MTKRTRKSHNNAILNLRIPEPVLAQLTTISDAQYKSVSTVVRDLIVQYIQQNTIFLTSQNPTQQPIRKPMSNTEYKFLREQQMRDSASIPTSPSQRVVDPNNLSEDDWL